MEHKENLVMGQTFSSSPTKSMNVVKPEPQEAVVPPLAFAPSGSRQNVSAPNGAGVVVKPEPVDAASVFIARGLPVPSYANQLGASGVAGVPKSEPAPAMPLGPIAVGPIPQPPVQEAPIIPYKIFTNAGEIVYDPEGALKEGLNMVKAIRDNVKKLELGSKLRKDVWLREIESLQNQGAPSTMIAVCGATGAGKSSTLNAILDDNIVPTSGMRACTAVVTEISYHAKSTINGDVSFLSYEEWRQELAVLLDDMIDEDGNVKRSTDLRSDAGVAWSKVHAVYPSISQDMLAHMTPEQIIARDSKVAKILGTTKKIVANNSKQFGHEIAKYIDSKEKKRGDKKDKKGKDKDDKKSGEKSLFDKAKAAVGMSKDKGKSKDDDPEGPAYWPLIRQVQVRCNAKALRTGAILVDLPGVADANAARNSIAKDYMKKCDCIWILAPITRAVDDKTARDLLGDAFKMQLMMDGNYDPSTVTFIATKCDDISCSEVIPALGLENDDELEEIEERIEQCRDETQEWKGKKSSAEALCKTIDKDLKEIRAHLKEHKEHLEALENGEPFEAKLTAKTKSKSPASARSKGKKRKNSRGGKKGSPKRRKSVGDDSDDDVEMIDSDEDMDKEESEEESDSDVESVHGSDSEAEERGSDAEGSDDGGSKSGSDEEDEAEEAQITVDDVKARIEETKKRLTDGRELLNEARKEKKEANDMLATLKKRLGKAQKDKNAFCSLKRSEFSRDVLKEDFRTGLKDLDDAAAEERDPDSFDPTQNIRDYAAIDLPVFTVSARDYVRIKNQVKGDGDSTCFSKPEETGVPQLQKWCHSLTVSSRERAARNFLTHLKTFANQVRQYVEGIGDVTVSDREALREKWESTPLTDDDDDNEDDYDNPFSMRYDQDAFMAQLDRLDRLAAGLGDAGMLYSMNKKPTKVDARGEPIGITPRLNKNFKVAIDKCVEDLKRHVRDGLEEKCEAGAANAAQAAIETADNFAAGMHWATYRATLRRHGAFRRDLNEELIGPMTKNIASSWAAVFEGDLFAAFEASATTAVEKLIRDVEASAPVALRDRVRNQGESCVEAARVALAKTVSVVRKAMDDQQKEVSRCLAPHVQQALTEGYDEAMLERGTGSVARQKAVFRKFIADNKDDVFTGGADVLLERLDKAADAVGQGLDDALKELSEQCEVNMAVLWEGPRDDPAQVRARGQMVEHISVILRQIALWQTAEQIRKAKADADAEANWEFSI